MFPSLNPSKNTTKCYLHEVAYGDNSTPALSSFAVDIHTLFSDFVLIHHSNSLPDGSECGRHKVYCGEPVMPDPILCPLLQYEKDQLQINIIPM